MMAAASLTVAGGPSGGAELPRPAEAADLMEPMLLTDMHPRWTAVHRDQSAVLGDLLIWPSLTAGLAADSNPYHQHARPPAQIGAGLSPQVLIERDAGSNRTDAYAVTNLRLYPSQPRADTVEGRAGVLHEWNVTRATTVRLQSEVSRRTDPFDNTALVAARPDRGLIFETDALGAASVEQRFDRVLLALSATLLRADFDASSAVRKGARHTGFSGETVGTLKGRAGFMFGAHVYAFAEPTIDGRALDVRRGVAMGTRAVAGVGVLHASLLGAEAFAGWQQHTFPSRVAVQAPVVGGRLTSSPRPGWHIAGQTDETIGDVAVGTAADPLGTPTRVRTVEGSLGYDLLPRWRAEVHAGAVWISYVGRPRSDRLVFGDLRVDYGLSRSVDLTGLVRVAALASSTLQAGYLQTAATLAATYHY